MTDKKRPVREGIMLCYPTEAGRVSRLGQHAFAQPKLNGERCRVEWFHGEPILISSYGNQFQYLNHITDAIFELSKKEGQIPWDGELYVHGWSRERIHSACSRKVNENPDSSTLQFHAFDYQDPGSIQWKRIKFLEYIRGEYISGDTFQVVPTAVITTSDWSELALDYCNLGYEGIILRNLAGLYVEKRSVAILKYKPTETDEYSIIGVTEGEGWAEGMLGAFVVRGDDGTEFSVGSGKTLTKERRRKFWGIRGELPGKMLIVKHEKMKTRGGKPIAAVANEVKGVDI